MTDTIEPGDHVRIGDGKVDWVVLTMANGVAHLRSGMTDRLKFDIPLERLWVRVKG
jgi:hypothetical protein